MQNNIYVSILIMAAVTYLIRMLPLTLMRKPIRSRFVKSFLYYVPYVTLSVMTFPAILYATDSVLLGAIGMAAALVAAFCGASLTITAVISCVSVYLSSLII